MEATRLDSGSGHSLVEDGATKKQGSEDDIPNPFAAEDVTQRLSESDKTKEFMEDPSFLEKLEDLSKSSQNLVNHMADHRVMTALAVLLDVDVTVPEITADNLQSKEPEHFTAPTFESESPSRKEKEPSTSRVPLQKEKSSQEPTSTGSPLPRSISEKIETCRGLKDEGNKLVKEGEWKKAIKKYHHALMYVKCVTDKLDAFPGLEASLGREQPSEEQKKEATQLMLSLLNNLSLCLLKLEEWEKVIKHTSKVLAEKGDDVKALYRRGTAYTQVKKLEEAESDLKEAEKLNPGDKNVKKQMEIVRKKKLEEQQNEKKMYAAMFSST